MFHLFTLHGVDTPEEFSIALAGSEFRKTDYFVAIPHPALTHPEELPVSKTSHPTGSSTILDEGEMGHFQATVD